MIKRYSSGGRVKEVREGLSTTDPNSPYLPDGMGGYVNVFDEMAKLDARKQSYKLFPDGTKRKDT